VGHSATPIVALLSGHLIVIRIFYNNYKQYLDQKSSIDCFALGELFLAPVPRFLL